MNLKVLIGICCLTIFALSCEPEGQLGRQPVALKGSRAEESRQYLSKLSSKGLPDFCEFRSLSPTMGCVQCKVDGNLLKRCFDWFGDRLFADYCKYNERALRCIITKGPRVLTLRFDRSMEEDFMEEYLAILDSMESVIHVQDQLNPTEQTIFLKWTHFLRDHSSKIIEGGDYQTDLMEFVKVVCQKPCKPEAFRRRVTYIATDLNSKANLGTLVPFDGVKLVVEPASILIPNSHLPKILGSFSFDGLKGN